MWLGVLKNCGIAIAQVFTQNMFSPDWLNGVYDTEAIGLTGIQILNTL